MFTNQEITLTTKTEGRKYKQKIHRRHWFGQKRPRETLSLTNFYHSRAQHETEDKARQFEESLMKELFIKCDLYFNKQIRDGTGSRDGLVILQYIDDVLYMYIYHNK